jgi:DNA-binding IclR family transcriptional regulator
MIIARLLAFAGRYPRRPAPTIAFRSAEQTMNQAPRSKRSDVVVAVTRALGVLGAFTIAEPHLSLAELSSRVRLPKTSTLRLARSLASCEYLVQVENGAWRLGPAAAWLGAQYQVAFDLHNNIGPEMRELALRTGHSVSYFVRDGEKRIRLLHVSGAADAGAARLGEPLPLDKGSPGQVLLAFSGRPGAVYDEIRKRGFHSTIAEAKKLSASVAAPVFGARWGVVGALCIGMPANVATEGKLRSLAPAVMMAAERLSRKLQSDQGPRSLAMARSTWHPGRVD